VTLNARRILAAVFAGVAMTVIAAIAIVLAGFLGVPSKQLVVPSAPRVTARAQTGFPDASDTGVPAGTTLRSVPGQVSQGPGWRFDPRGWVDVYGSGAVLSDLSIPYNVNVTASNVTIEDVQVTVGGPDAIGISLRNTSDVTIEDSTISGINTSRGRMMTGIKDIFGDSTGLDVAYDNIAEFETGIQLESGLVEDNYIHEPGYLPGDHTNGVMSNGGTGLLTIEHNTILINRSQTDAIGLFEDFGAERNRRIVDNLLAGGGYVIYGGQKPDGPPASDIVITGNEISTMYYARGGYYGCAAQFNPQGSQDVWSDNTWESTTAASFSICD
jgi:phage baseplate assembly protein gpV